MNDTGCDLGKWREERERTGSVQGRPSLLSELEAFLGYMRPYLKRQANEKVLNLSPSDFQAAGPLLDNKLILLCLLFQV